MKEYRRKLKTTVYIDLDHLIVLDNVSKATRVPVAELIRQGIDEVLERYDGAPGGVQP